LSRVAALSVALLAGCATQGSMTPGPMNQGGTLLHSDDFVDARNWVLESEQPARVVARDGVLDIDTPAGLTLWFKHRLDGPVSIEFDATAVSAGGPNDQVSDLNVFWMARNADDESPPCTRPRRGRFDEYDDLTTYYVGLGGNRNTTTRFRRYVGKSGHRPLLPPHDLSDPSVLLVPNRRQRITLIADGGHIEYRRDGKPLFVYTDDVPYTQGWFALRTTFSHLRIENLRIRAL
jgi:hypothetical protein